MKNFRFVTLALASLTLLASCGGSKSLEGTYTYIGFNGMTNAEEDWTLKVAKDDTYILSLVNDFLSAENYGNVKKNDDGTYTLYHTGSKDEAYPYPTIVYGFAAVDTAGTDWRCTGSFDFDAMTFTPKKAA